MKRNDAARELIDADSLFVDVYGMRVHYKREGQGQPLVLLHGTGSSLHTFDLVARQLSDRFDVIRPDLPGFGLTGPRTDADYRTTTYVGFVTGFLDAVGVDSALIGGNSFGGLVAWNLALDRPDRVDALVLINATGYPSKSVPLTMRLARNPVGRLVLRVVGGSRAGIRRSLLANVGPGSTAAVTDELIDRMHAMMTRVPGNRQAFIDFARTEHPDRSAQIRDIRVSVAVLRSASIDGQHFERDLPDARSFVHPGGGHLLPDEDPTWVAASIDEFLSTPIADGGR